MRTITNKEFELARRNLDNVRIINKCLAKHKDVMSFDELKSCGLYGLWKCLKYHDNSKKRKFTTSLYSFVRWECLSYIKKKTELNDEYLDNYSIYDEEKDNIIEDIKDCLNRLPKKDRKILEQYYYQKLTLKEIGKLNNYSRQAAGQNRNKAETRLKDIYIG